MKKLRYACIGAGTPCIVTSCHLPAITAVEDYELRAVADLNPGVRETAEKYNCEWTLDSDELFARDDIDVVAIGVPDQFHYELVKKALQSGKHVICEKPLAMTQEQCDELLRLAEEKRLVLSVVSNTRNLGLWKDLKSRLTDVKMLKYTLHAYIFPYPEGSFYRKKESGGQFLHNGFHICDLMSYLSDSVPAEVISVTARGGETADQFGFDTYVSVSMKMENGVLVQIVQDLTHPVGYPRQESVYAWQWDSHVEYDSQKTPPTPAQMDSIGAFRAYYQSVAELICGDYGKALEVMKNQNKEMKAILAALNR